MPALLFNPFTEYRIVQFLFFWFLAFIFGKKTNPFITILIITFIILFNLIIPYGRVIFSIGVFKITSGSLTAGIHRAFTLAALVLLSKVTVREDLKLPGVFGEILGESLRMFSVLIDRKYRIIGKNIFMEMDNLMLELSEKDILVNHENPNKTKPIGYIILILIVILSWTPWIKLISF